MGKYIAVTALQLVDAEGKRVAIEPASATASGLFEHEFDKKTEKDLIEAGVIRAPEDLEEHAEPTAQTELVDSRQIEGTATEVKTDEKVDPKADTKPKDKKADAKPSADGTLD